MEKPVLTFNQIAPLILHKYERYLPTAFDESMSLVQKVNKVIIQLNQIGELTNNVVEQWNEVMEWIVNDGMTEVIVAKLDNMVADGTLDTIINHNIFNDLNTRIDGNVQSINNINDEITNVKSDITTVSDDLTLLKDTDIKKLKEKTNFYSPEMFGAKGDGVTDDTQAWNDMIETVPDGANIKAYGKYLVTAYSNNIAITLTKRVHIDGGGNGELICNTDLLNSLIYAPEKLVGISIKGMRFNLNNLGRVGINLMYCEHVLIDNCYFTGYKGTVGQAVNDSAVNLQACINFTVSNCVFDQWGYNYPITDLLVRAISCHPVNMATKGMIFNNRFINCNQGVVSNANNMIIANNYFEGTLDNDVYILEGCHNVRITNNTFIHTADEAIVIGCNDAIIANNTFREVKNKCIRLNDCLRLTITGNIFHNDGFSGGYISEGGDAGSPLKNLTISNNTFYGRGTYIMITLKKTFNFRFSSNTFEMVYSETENGGSILRLMDTTEGHRGFSIDNNIIRVNKGTGVTSISGIRQDGVNVSDGRVAGNVLIDCTQILQGSENIVTA